MVSFVRVVFALSVVTHSASEVKEIRLEVPRSGVTQLPLVFITTTIFGTVAEIESGSTLRETCLATEVQESYSKPTVMHGARPPETCFAAHLHINFS